MSVRIMPGPALQNFIFSKTQKFKVLYDNQPFHDDLSCLGGTATLVSLDATDGGTATEANQYGGTETDLYNLGGFEFSGCFETMQAVNITLGEFNDETINLTITNNSVPFNLSGFGLQAVFKTAAGVDDGDPTTLILSTGNGAITITNAAGGLATLVIPNADLQSTNFGFWRVDVTQGGTQVTAMYGTVTIRAL